MGIYFAELWHFSILYQNQDFHYNFSLIFTKKIDCVIHIFYLRNSTYFYGCNHINWKTFKMNFKVNINILNYNFAPLEILCAIQITNVLLNSEYLCSLKKKNSLDVPAWKIRSITEICAIIYVLLYNKFIVL